MSSSESDSESTIVCNVKLKNLIKKRGVVKTKLTIFKKYLSKIKADSLTAEHLIDLELRTARITSVFKDFESIQDEIETLSEELDGHLEERETFENTYFSCVSLSKSYLAQIVSPGTPGAADGSAHQVCEPREHDSIKYPDISLPSFNGNLTDWIEFRDTFDALVNQTSLKPIQKFKYLKSCLVGSALEVLSSLEYAEESHAIAWQLLCERYNSPKTLVYTHLRALLNIDTVPSTATALRSLNDNISKHLRILRSLKVSTDDWDLLIIFFLSSKLEKPLQNRWEEKINSRELPTLQEFKSFLRSQADLKEAVSHAEPSKPAYRELLPRKAMVTTCPPSHTNSKVTPKYSTYRNQCPNCKEVHFINQCPKFMALNATSRIRVVKRLGLCINCLGSNHILPNCRASSCRTCKGKHHTLLHIAQTDTSESNPTRQSTLYSTNEQTTSVESQSVNLITNQRPSNSSDNTNTYSLAQTKCVILSTARVKVLDKHNQTVILRCLLDSGSQSNFITENAYKKLNLPIQKTNLEVLGFNENVTNINQSCNITIQSNDDSFSTNLSCFIVPNICHLPTFARDAKPFNIPKRFHLADELFYQGGEIDLLLGAEQFYQLLCIGQHRLGEGLPILQRTRLGYVISGPYATNLPQKVRCNLIQTKLLQTFWGSEESHPVTTIPDDEYIKCEKIFNEHSRTSDGNFVVTIPFKEPPTSLGKSRSIVYKRFKTLESKFSRDPEYKEKYVKFMKDFENAGHMVQVKNTEQCNYLPHHAVLTPHKLSTPIRVVIDASFKTDNKKSLNDIQYKGTINQDDLVNILLRFRKNKYVISADIERMYRMIYINPNQRHLQCILWRENPTEPLRTYILTTLSFGLKSAPHLATRCLQQLAQENQHEYPEAAAAICGSFYMDDLLHGGDDERQLGETAVRIQQILSGANFYLRKWKSNSDAILKTVSNTEHTHTTTSPSALAHDTHKVLGLAWCSNSDSLMYQFKHEPVPEPLTKRKILSLASAIYDPIGLLNPTLIIAKCIIQRLWKENKIDWDVPLPTGIRNEWETFYTKLFTLTSLRVPRHALINDYVTLQLHGFSDSSLTAFGCAIYIRTIDKYGNILTRLLCSKTRVARNETIPKLELRAALLLAQLYKKVGNALKCNFTKTYFWCDSNVALAWIKSQQPNNLTCFVKNRVIEIQSLTDNGDWHWVSSSDNSADLLTRGLQADKLADCALWWEGPSWLQKHSDEWPTNKTSSIPLPNSESTETHCIVSTNLQPNLFVDRLFQRWSDVNKLINCIAFIFRFTNNCLNRNNKLSGPFSVDELNFALNKLIEISQIEMFPTEYNLLKNNKPLLKSSSLLSLNPFMENKLIRVGGRLGLSDYSHDKKHPIILSHKHILTKLIMSDQHVRLLHAGPQLLLSSIRERFWPINGKCLANKIVEKCVTCFRAKPRSQTPIMGNLPPTRVKPAPPFLFTTLDYGGPYTVRDRRGRGYKTYKCYIAIFNCMATKAVHIELISGLQTAAFFSAFKRFTSRRGVPKEMLTDNASTFHGACNELTDLYNFLNKYSNELIVYCAREKIQWKFLPPYTPHMGGLHEASIRRCKFHLKRVLGQALLTYEEFSTILVQVEGILNSRPLCPIPNSNTDEITCLTPAHFLISRTPNSMPDYDYKDIPTNRLTLHQQLQQLQQDFWNRWSRDYLGLLQERTKWRCCKGGSLRVGAVVLVREERLPPCLWRLGRIVSCCTGRDGVARVAEIQTARGIIKRSFNNICPLPIDAIDT